MSELKGHTGILLEKLIIKFDKVLGDNFEIYLGDKQDIILQNGLISNPYTSVIIGSNGTGKSYLLKVIADILLQIESISTGSKVKYTDVLFELSYFNGDEYFVVANYTEESLKHKTRKKVDYIIHNKKGLVQLYAPEAILVTSVLLTDRFTIFKNPLEKYKYLGVRNLNSPTTAGTRNYVKRTVEHIVKALSEFDAEFIVKLKSLLHFLKFKDTFIIYYTPKYKDKFFREDLTVDRFIKLFDNFKDPENGFSKRKDSERIPNSISYYRSHVSNSTKLIQEIVEFLIDLKVNYFKTFGKSKVEYFEFDVLKSELSLDKFKIIQVLQSLDLITYPSISLVKENDSIDLEETSSGEYHFISTMIGLFASIQQNSVVLIDEPEVSLHPNWQMKYIHYLKEIFNQYCSCHFILTSHSHFIVSDLEGKSSSVTALIRDLETNKLSAELLKGQDTFGWSAEQVLLDVFDVPTTRNFAVAEKLGLLLDFIADERNSDSAIKEKFMALELDKLDKLKDTDPLKEVYNTIVKEYVLDKSQS